MKQASVFIYLTNGYFYNQKQAETKRVSERPTVQTLLDEFHVIL